MKISISIFHISSFSKYSLKHVRFPLRLLPTFAGVLRKKIRTRAGFNKILTDYISEESLINGVYDKKYSLRDFSFW